MISRKLTQGAHAWIHHEIDFCRLGKQTVVPVGPTSKHCWQYEPYQRGRSRFVLLTFYYDGYWILSNYKQQQNFYYL